MARQARERRAADPERYRAIQRAAHARAYAKDPEKFRARARAYRARDPDKANAIVKASRRPGYMPEYLADYYQRNKDKIKAAVRARELALGDALKPVNAAKAMRRLCRKRQATPAWADHAAIEAIYREAARLAAETGIAHHVDHIVPLQSKLVCGLHVESNLRPVPRTENQSKSNRWWPDGPFDP